VQEIREQGLKMPKSRRHRARQRSGQAGREADRLAGGRTGWHGSGQAGRGALLPEVGGMPLDSQAGELCQRAQGSEGSTQVVEVQISGPKEKNNKQRIHTAVHEQYSRTVPRRVCH